MTKEEMKALVASKIASQGNQVDVSGTLTTLLNEIIDGMGEKIMVISKRKAYELNGRTDVTKEELLDAGIDFDNCESYTRARIGDRDGDNYSFILRPIQAARNGEEMVVGSYYFADPIEEGCLIEVTAWDAGVYRVLVIEI